jgi:hypothetical protein
MRRAAAALCVAGLLGLVVVAAATADPRGSKGSFTFMAMCDNGMTVPVVVNNANGQGSGSQNNTTAEWAPAHVIGSQLVFHPTVFDLTFTFTPADGSPPESFDQQDARLTGKTRTTCTLSGSQSDPAGDTFSISGTVGGWLS